MRLLLVAAALVLSAQCDTTTMAAPPATSKPTTRRPVATTRTPVTTQRPVTNKERNCACTLGKLWVDVAVAIDVSAGMTSAGVTQVVADLASVFAQSSVSQVDGQVTRIGVVTYASTANVVYNMSYFTSSDQFMNEIWGVIPASTPDRGSNLQAGLQAANDLLAQGRMNGKRSNVRQAIIVYASDYTEGGQYDPLSLATEIKTSGIHIITNAFNQGGEEKVLQNLAKLASPGMAYNSVDTNLVGEIQLALCQVNCFCPTSWTQYSNNITNPTNVYGSCLRFGDIDANWIASKFSCQNLYKGGYLASEFNANKHAFNQALAKMDPTANSPYSFHIGLSYQASMGQFAWEQPAGQPLLPLSGSSYTNGWNSGYPSSGSTTPNQGCVINMQAGTAFNLGWQDESCVSVNKRYLCQVASCDTDTYCP